MENKIRNIPDMARKLKEVLYRRTIKNRPVI